MARNRMIKPDFWEDEKLARKTSMQARLLYIALWNYSDDYGVVKGDNIYLKNTIFPYNDIQLSDFKGWLQELLDIKRLKPFEANGEQYYYIHNFLKHQKIDKPSKDKRNPEPPPGILDDYSTNTRGGLDEGSTMKIKENKIKEREVEVNKGQPQQKLSPFQSCMKWCAENKDWIMQHVKQWNLSKFKDEAAVEQWARNQWAEIGRYLEANEIKYLDYVDEPEKWKGFLSNQFKMLARERVISKGSHFIDPMSAEKERNLERDKLRNRNNDIEDILK